MDIESSESARFLDGLSGRTYPFLRNAKATLRIDLEDHKEKQSWSLDIMNGTITTTRGQSQADAVLGATTELFDRIVTGRANAMTAALRGELVISGNTQLLVAFKCLLPAATEVVRPTDSATPPVKNTPGPSTCQEVTA